MSGFEGARAGLGGRGLRLPLSWMLCLAWLLGGAPAVQVQAAESPLKLVRVADGLNRPLWVTHAPGDFGRVFILEQPGLIKILDLQTGTVLPTPFLDIIDRVDCCQDTGLFGLAFDPGYAANGIFYVAYLNKDKNSELAQYRVLGDPATSNGADPASGAVLLTVSEPYQSHTIGWMAFGPKDHHLYVELGDGGSFCDPDQRAQNLMELHGKILRIAPDRMGGYTIPPDNPFVGKPGRDEIWAYGLRNPWRNAFDPLTGDLYIADVGQKEVEELSFQPGASTGGENYGWDCMEGSACSAISDCTESGCACGAPELVLPIHEYAHDLGCSITGGEVYRGCAIPGLAGSYFFGDLCSTRIWRLRHDGGGVKDFEELTGELRPVDGPAIGFLVSFGKDAYGEIYVVDLLGQQAFFGGQIFKIVADREGPFGDCNANGREDACEILDGSASDQDGNGAPDRCQPPTVACLAGENPAGRNIPGPKKGGTAANPDGFLTLEAEDLLDPAPELYLVDPAVPATHGPYPSGAHIKYTRAPGAPAASRRIGGGAPAPVWHVTGAGQPEIFAVDADGLASERLLCPAVPPSR